jgi:DNA-binding SARP family transcriptional activator/Tfp pilus assembly protein PilF
LAVRLGGRVLPVPAGKQRVVLAVLLLSAGQVVSAEKIADMLWGTAPPPSAQVAVRNYVKRLRQTLAEAGPGLIGTWPGGYLLSVEPSGLDVARFQNLLRAAQAAVRDGSWEQATAQATAALALWRGDPLVDIGSDALAAREVPRLAELYLQALEARTDADLKLGRHASVIGELRRQVSTHPLREHLHAQLMLALYQSGRQAEALAAYQHVRRVLREELGTEPGTRLRDLHQQILTGDPALADTAPAAAGGPPAAVPRQLPGAVRHFTGRSAELAALAGLLGQAEPPSAGGAVITAICGTAGVGKTALALHWAHGVATEFPDGQLYVNLRGFDPSGTPVTPEAGVRGLLDVLGVPPERIPVGLDAQAGLYRSLLAGKRMLVLLDNARDANQVRALLPGTASSMAVVTSRSRLTGLAVTEGASQISLDVLTEPEARELLASWVGPARVAAEPEAVSEITGLCARLPLALAITAARAEARPGLPLATLAAELRQATERLDALTTGEAATDVRVVFSWSYRNLGERAARMFRLAGLHPGPAISAPAAASLAGVPLTEARAALRELTGACLLAEHIPGRFVFHDLLRAYATEQARAEDSDTEHRAAIHRMLDHYLRVGYPAALLLQPSRAPLTLPAIQPGVSPEVLTDHQQAMAWLETERQVLLAVTAAAASAGFDTHAWQISWSLATFLQWRGYWSDAIKLQRTALAATQCLGDLIAQASAHYLLGMAVATAGAPEDASTQMSRAPALRQQLGDPIDQARSHTGLAWVSGLQGRHGDALGHAQHALGLYQAAGHRAGQARALNAVGWHHAQLGDYEQALTCCLESLALQRESVDLPLEADTLHSIGYAYHHLGHHAQAISYYQQVLDLYRRQQDRHHEAATLACIGDAHEAMGNLDTARENWKLALNIHDELHHADAAKVRAKLGKLSSPTAAPSSDDASDSDSSAGIP